GGAQQRNNLAARCALRSAPGGASPPLSRRPSGATSQWPIRFAPQVSHLSMRIGAEPPASPVTKLGRSRGGGGSYQGGREPSGANGIGIVFPAAKRRRTEMARKPKATFDPKTFLATVNHGRTVSTYPRDAAVFQQGGP